MLGTPACAAVHEVFGDFGLAVDHHGLAGQLFERQAMARAVDADLHAVVDETVGMHPGADAGLVQQIHRDLFDDAGAHAAKHMVGGLPLQDDVLDAAFVEELTQQQPGRAGTDDDDLCSHQRKLVCSTADRSRTRRPWGHRNGILTWP